MDVDHYLTQLREAVRDPDADAWHRAFTYVVTLLEVEGMPAEVKVEQSLQVVAALRQAQNEYDAEVDA